MAEVRDRHEVTTRLILRELLDALKQSGIDVLAAYLYGSHASGTAQADSDIDVAVVSEDLSGDRDENWNRLNRIASRIDVRLEVIGFRPEHFRDENPLAWEIKQNGLSLS